MNRVYNNNKSSPNLGAWWKPTEQSEKSWTEEKVRRLNIVPLCVGLRNPWDWLSGAEELWFPLEEYSHLLARGQIVCRTISQRRESFRDWLILIWNRKLWKNLGSKLFQDKRKHFIWANQQVWFQCWLLKACGMWWNTRFKTCQNSMALWKEGVKCFFL